MVKPSVLTLALAVLSGGFDGSAVGQPLLWATRAGAANPDWGLAVATDGAGHTLATGRFMGTVTFGAGEPNETVLTSVGPDDLFVAKYDGAGRLVWATQAGGTIFEWGLGIAADGAGNSYVTGSFSAAATFGAGEPNETVLTSAGDRDLFVAKYDGAGRLVWATAAGGTGDDEGLEIAVDAAGDSYATGSFQGTATFGAGEPNQTDLTSAGSADIFVARYDGSGLLAWATRAGGTEWDSGAGLAIGAAGDGWITGYFAGTATFGAGEPNQTDLTSAGGDDVFVARYDGSGELVWATRAGGGTVLPGLSTDLGLGIAVDAAGSSSVTGTFTETATFGAGEPNETVLTSAGFGDAFVARYDASGLLAWATSAGSGTNSDPGQGIAVDGDGRSHVTGYFFDTATFGAGGPNEIVLTSAGNQDLFVAVYDGSGRLLSAARAGGTGNEAGMAIAVDAAGNSSLSGTFQGLATFGPGEPNETVLASEGWEDIVVAKYAALPIFRDGFESGDASAWSAAVP
jgi:hypothetical protein